MPEENKRRKTRVVRTQSIFNQIKRLYKVKSKDELLEITSLSKAALNTSIRKIELCENEPTFETLYKSAGRKREDRSTLHTELRSLLAMTTH